MEAHHRELGVPWTFDPFPEMVEVIENAGNLVCACAREDSKLVGYLIWYLSPDLTDRISRIATQGAWYVEPAHRAHSTGERLLKVTLQHMREIGVKRAFPHFWAVGSIHDAGMDKLLRRLGGKKTEVVYLIDLEK